MELDRVLTINTTRLLFLTCSFPTNTSSQSFSRVHSFVLVQYAVGSNSYTVFSFTSIDGICSAGISRKYDMITCKITLCATTRTLSLVPTNFIKMRWHRSFTSMYDSPPPISSPAISYPDIDIAADSSAVAPTPAETPAESSPLYLSPIAPTFTSSARNPRGRCPGAFHSTRSTSHRIITSTRYSYCSGRTVWYTRWLVSHRMLTESLYIASSHHPHGSLCRHKIM